MAPRDVVELFQRSPKLVSVYATLVLPIEARHRHPSLYPELYRINYRAEGFDYLPGAHGGEAYVHEYGQLDWLAVGAIFAGAFSLHVERITSLAAHHIFVITRKTPVVPSFRPFEADRMVVLPPVFADYDESDALPIPRKLAMQCMLYARSVKAVTHRDFYAKLRQLLSGKALEYADPRCIAHIANYFVFMSGTSCANDYGQMIGEGWCTRVANRVRQLAADCTEGLVGLSSYRVAKKLLDWEPFSYTLRVHTVDGSTLGEKLLAAAAGQEAVRVRAKHAAARAEHAELFPPQNPGARTNDASREIAAPEAPTDGQEHLSAGDREELFNALSSASRPPPLDDTAIPDPQTVAAVVHEVSQDRLPRVFLPPRRATGSETASVPTQQLSAPRPRVAVTAPATPQRMPWDFLCPDEGAVDAELSRPSDRVPSSPEPLPTLSFGLPHAEVIGCTWAERAGRPGTHGLGSPLLLPDMMLEEPRTPARWASRPLDVVTLCARLRTIARDRPKPTVSAPPGFAAHGIHCFRPTARRHTPVGTPARLDAEVRTLLARVNARLGCNREGVAVPAWGRFSILASGAEHDDDADTDTDAAEAANTTTCVAAPAKPRTPRARTKACITPESRALSPAKQPGPGAKPPSPPGHPATQPPSPKDGESPTSSTTRVGGQQESTSGSHGYTSRQARVLRACGFDDLAPQYAGTPSAQTRIWAIQEGHVNAPRSCNLRGEAASLAAVLDATGRHFYKATLGSARALALASDIKNGRSGKLWSQDEARRDLTQRLAGVSKAGAAVDICAIHGAGGSGKSQAVIDWLRRRCLEKRGIEGPDVCVVLPTRVLRDKWVEDVPDMDPRMFKTYEKALMQMRPHELLVFDDYTKLPPGLIEACAFRHSGPILLLGDPRQTAYHERNEEAAIAGLKNAADVYMAYSDFYVNATHRNARTIANALGVHASSTQSGQLTVQFEPPADSRPFLYPSLASADAATAAGRTAYTYAGCQGLTCSSIAVVLDEASRAVSDEAWYTALSRARDDIVVMPEYRVDGYNSADFTEDKLSATPYLQSFVNAFRDVDAQPRDHKAPEAVIIETGPTRTHIPPESLDAHYDGLVEAAGEKFDREARVGDGYTNVFQTEDPFVQLFPHQQAKDEALWQLTLGARIVPGDAASNAADFRAKLSIGSTLFENYRVAMGLPQAPLKFQSALWSVCEREVAAKYGEKSVAQLINGATRQSPDFDDFMVALFNKSQWVKKPEKMGQPAKAGQAIASFKQTVVMEFGIMARYMRKVREHFEPTRIFVNCGTRPEQLSDWVRKQWRHDGSAFANDYTRFDQSQDASMLAFEYYHGQHVGVPADVLDRYLRLKMNARAFTGFLGIMRLSGEGPTFDANTACNIAYHFTRFAVPDNANLVFAGDDMAQDCLAEEKPSFALIQRRLLLEGKPVVHTQQPGDLTGFCGWRFSRYGIVADPLKTHASLVLGRKVKGASDLLANYARLSAHAYGLGDRLQEILTPAELAAHQECVRIFVRSGIRMPELGEVEEAAREAWWPTIAGGWKSLLGRC